MMRHIAAHRATIMLAALLVFGAIVAQVVGDRKPSGPSLSSQAADGDGALALAMWLDRLGYPVARAAGT